MLHTVCTRLHNVTSFVHYVWIMLQQVTSCYAILLVFYINLYNFAMLCKMYYTFAILLHNVACCMILNSFCTKWHYVGLLCNVLHTCPLTLHYWFALIRIMLRLWSSDWNSWVIAVPWILHVLDWRACMERSPLVQIRRACAPTRGPTPTPRRKFRKWIFGENCTNASAPGNCLSVGVGPLECAESSSKLERVRRSSNQSLYLPSSRHRGYRPRWSRHPMV